MPGCSGSCTEGAWAWLALTALRNDENADGPFVLPNFNVTPVTYFIEYVMKRSGTLDDPKFRLYEPNFGSYDPKFGPYLLIRYIR